MPAQNVEGCSGTVIRTHTGNRTATVSEATDTYPESHRVTAQMATEITIARGARPRNIPAAVATPLPPRKRTYGENMWPSTAASPRATVNHAGPLDHGPRMTTGTAPLSTSVTPPGIAGLPTSRREHM